ncbi:MAG TPA: nuclear transport factor 2 family protein [Myxococcota bacterium]|nr:nuclear transport factor 2 family protein [Myxococcota bacterium]
MSHIPQFVKYAAAFEEAFRSDDWSAIAPFFSEDARYDAHLPPPLGGSFAGRPAILSYFKFVLDAFDRRFATREVSLIAGPRENGDAVWIRGGARYTAPGVPGLYFELEETVTFAGDRIRGLEDRYDPETIARVQAYLRANGAKLGISGF